MEFFHNEFFRLIRPLDREQSGKGGIIQASGEALELDAALVSASICPCGSHRRFRLDRGPFRFIETE